MNIERSSSQKRAQEESEFEENVGIVEFHAVRLKRSHLGAVDREAGKRFQNRGHCSKSRFRDLAEAIETLHRIQRYRDYSRDAGLEMTHRNERRAYK